MVVDGHSGCLGAFAALKRQYRHLKLLLSVGGAGAASETFPTVASDPVRRQNFGRSARDLVRNLGLDGIDGEMTETSPKDFSDKYDSRLGASQNGRGGPVVH